MINDADECESSESPASQPIDAWPYGALRDGGVPRRPFSVFRYWLPGFVLAVIVGVASLATAAVVGGFGWATLGIPLALGAFCGYGLPGSKAFQLPLLRPSRSWPRRRSSPSWDRQAYSAQ